MQAGERARLKSTSRSWSGKNIIRSHAGESLFQPSNTIMVVMLTSFSFHFHPRRHRSVFVSFLAAILTISTLGLTACSDHKEAEPGGGKLNVKTSFYPLQYLAEQIGGDQVQVESLTPPGTDAHSLELSPKSVDSLRSADAVIYLSGFQSAVDEAVAHSSPKHTLDVHEAAQIGPTGNAKSSSNALAGGDDPHFWLDAKRMAQVAVKIGDFFSEVDAEHASQYQQRAEETAERMNQLSEKMIAGLSNCDLDTFIVSHEAFGYLADEVGLRQVGVSGLDPEVAPSPQRIKDISKLVKETGTSVIFTEVNVSPKVMEVLAEDLGVKTSVLDPIATLNDPTKDYPTLMGENLQHLQEGLHCQ